MPPSTTARRLVEPAFSHVPVYVETYGPEVADLAAMADFAPDPEQERALDALFAIRSDGRCAAYEFCVVCSRQNLKTGLFKQAALGWLFLLEVPRVTWSAHVFTTTKGSFNDLVGLIENTPELSKRLKKDRIHGIHRSTADMSIELEAGPVIAFLARTNSGGRGLSGDRVVLDEGMFLKSEHMASLMPTLSARPDPQLVIGSSAGLAESAVLRSMRDRGRGGLTARQAYLEWCAPEGACADPECLHLLGTPGCALDNRDFWLMANPQMGRRILEETIEAERNALASDPMAFARERLGWWDDPTAGGPFPSGIWQLRCESASDLESMAASKITGETHLGLDLSWDRRSCSLGIAGKRDDGKVQVELVEYVRDDDDPVGPGVEVTTGNVVERAALLSRRLHVPVRIEGNGPAAALKPALERAGANVLELGNAEVVAACGDLYDRVVHGGLVHIGQERLDLSVGGAEQSGGNAWRWARRGKYADLPPLMSVTLALGGFAGGSPGIYFFTDDDLEAE